MKPNNILNIFRTRNLFTFFCLLIFSFTSTAQNDVEEVQDKVYIGVGAGSILHLNDENNTFNMGLNSSFEVSYSIFPNFGISAQAGFSKFNVLSRDEVYLELENSKYTPFYNTVNFNNIESEQGMDIKYVIAGPLYTYSSGKFNFDFIPKAGVAFTSPFYEYEYTIEGYSALNNYDSDIVNYEGSNSIAFLLDIELAIRTQLSDSGLGLKFFTKFIHSSFIEETTRSRVYTSRDSVNGPILFEGKMEENDEQKVELNALIFGLSLIYSF